MSFGSVRVTGLIAAAAMIGSVAAGCAPPPPETGPSLAVQVGVVFNHSTLEIKGDPSGFAGSGDYAIDWTVIDTATDLVVASKSTVTSSEDLWSVGAAELSGLTITSGGGTSSTALRVSVTYSRNAQTATRTVSASPTWPTPTSPQVADLDVTQPGTYQLNHFTPAVCTPIGTTVNVVVTGGSESALVFFLDYSIPFGSNARVLPPGGGSVDLVTTTPCWSAAWVRGSLTQITGTAHAEFTWA